MAEHSNAAPRGKPRPPWLRALGSEHPPQCVQVQGRAYHWQATFKHDTFACTALYANPDDPHERVICKLNRCAPLGILPMRWLGTRLARREMRILQRLAHIPNLPRDAGPVHHDRQPLHHATAHWYIPGHPLSKAEPVSDVFFPALEQTLQQMHAHHVAHVDLNKRENILITEQGTPVLIDFQIHFALPERGMTNNPLTRAILRRLQRCDMYHLLKHRVRLRPDQLTAAQRDLDAMRPLPIRLWRRLATPLRQLRRRLLVRLGVRRGPGHAETELEPEQAFRAPATPADSQRTAP